MKNNEKEARERWGDTSTYCEHEQKTNMISVRKRIIASLDESGRDPTYMVMLNPEIIKMDSA